MRVAGKPMGESIQLLEDGIGALSPLLIGFCLPDVVLSSSPKQYFLCS